MKAFTRLIAFVAAALAVSSAVADVPLAPSPGIASKLLVRTTSASGELMGLQVTDLRSQRKYDNLVVQAEINNTGSKDVRLYYRFRWTDDAGMQVGDGEVWKPIVIMGKQSQMLKGTAYGPQATDFKIEMSAEGK